MSNNATPSATAVADCTLENHCALCARLMAHPKNTAAGVLEMCADSRRDGQAGPEREHAANVKMGLCRPDSPPHQRACPEKYCVSFSAGEICRHQCSGCGAPLGA